MRNIKENFVRKYVKCVKNANTIKCLFVIKYIRFFVNIALYN